MANHECDDISQQREPDYSELFREFVAQSVQATLDEIPADAPFLEQEIRTRAMHVLSYALKIPDAWPTTKALILHIAPKMEQAGHRDNWMDYLVEGLTCSKLQNDQLTYAELQWQIGHLHRLQSQFVSAQKALEASATIFSDLNNPKGQARCWNELGHMAWHRQQHAEAQEYAEAALAVLDVNAAERAMSLSILGEVATSRRQWEQGEIFFKEALHLHTIRGDRQRIAWTMQHLGFVLRNQGDFNSAVPYYEAAIQILTEIQDIRNCGIAQMSLGLSYFSRQRYIDALNFLQLAEIPFRKTNDLLHLAKVTTNMGLVFLAMREWIKARDNFARSIALYEQIHDVYASINALDGLGLAYSGLASYDSAVEIFESAQAKLPMVKNHPMHDKLRQDILSHLNEARSQLPLNGNSS